LLPQYPPVRADRAANRALSLAAFTLMEMMVVVAIIIILIGISVPLVINYWNNSKIDATRAKIQSIQNAAQTFQMKNGRWPQSVQELTVKDQYGNEPVLRDPQDITDSWGNPIVIDPAQGDQARPLIYSQGPNGQGPRIDNTK